MNEDIIPKIFISYSWTKTDFVVPLAERLREHGVDVVLDKWDLKEGQDKYVFMEQCVNNPDITKVLIICNKTYVDKANGRKGGVGDETAIISSEIYGNYSQEKFIPIVTEYGEKGEAYLPTYIKNRIYIDFSDEERFEESYEALLRNIYNKPQYRKPKLGKCPEWLDDEKVSTYKIKDVIRQIRNCNNEAKEEKLVSEFITKYIETLKDYYDPQKVKGEEIYKTFIEMKDVRDIFLDFLESISIKEKRVGELIADFFQNAYNVLTDRETFTPGSISWYDESFEIYRIFLWELFICVTAFFLNGEDFFALNVLLSNTYFIKGAYSSAGNGITDYTIFRHYSRVIEDVYKPTTENKLKYTLLGDCICNQREKKPLYTKKNIAEADLFLYQVYKAFNLKTNGPGGWRDYWFPELYVYIDTYNKQGIWNKMKSQRFAKKICDLIGVDSIEELKKRIELCRSDREMRYNGSFYSAPGILEYISVDEIAILN